MENGIPKKSEMFPEKNHIQRKLETGKKTLFKSSQNNTAIEWIPYFKKQNKFYTVFHFTTSRFLADFSA